MNLFKKIDIDKYDPEELALSTGALIIFILSAPLLIVQGGVNYFNRIFRTGTTIDFADKMLDKIALPIMILLLPLILFFLFIFFILHRTKLILPGVILVHFVYIVFEIFIKKLAEFGLLPDVNITLNKILNTFFPDKGKRVIELDASEYVFRLEFKLPRFRNIEESMRCNFSILQKFKKIYVFRGKFRSPDSLNLYYSCPDIILSPSAFISFMKIFYFRVSGREKLFKMHYKELLPLFENIINEFFVKSFTPEIKDKIKKFTRYEFAYNFIYKLFEHAEITEHINLLDELFVYYKLSDEN